MDQVKFAKTAFKKFEGIWPTQADHTHSNFLKTVFHKLYLVHSSILCPIYNSTHKSKKIEMKMAANFLQVRICSNEIIDIHGKNSLITLLLTKVQSFIKIQYMLIEPRTSDPSIIDEINCDAENMYLKELTGIIAKLACKEIYMRVSIYVKYV